MIIISDQSTELSPGFGQWLQDQADARGLTLAYLASRSQVPRAAIRKMINGQLSFARYYQLRALARGLGISNDEIYAAAGCLPPDYFRLEEQQQEIKNALNALLKPDEKGD